ncbi:MAG TPA: response regulator transcription factor [Casimicrobiaceae bacterium]|nr:response regulator transcription factor [Casimicrobiaceae bacterium]
MTTRDNARVSVLLVDDHAVVREGYRRLLERALEIAVVGEAASAAEAYRLFTQLVPDVVVMDISLPDVSGIEAMRHLLLRERLAKVLVFSIHEEAIFPDRAFRAGARGYITKASAPEVLVEAVRAVARGDRFLSPDIAQRVAVRALAGASSALKSLSDREFEIARLLARGRSVREIAKLLCLNHKTVANYQWAIRNKLGAATPIQLIQIARQSGLIGDST